MFSDTILAGADYELTVLDLSPEGTPTNLTGCTARLQARRSVEAAEAVVNLSSAEGGGMTLLPTEGRLHLRAPGALTATLFGTYVVQLELHWPGGRVDRLLDASGRRRASFRGAAEGGRMGG